MKATPRSERLHIGVFGRCNSGKSTLINALCGQKVAMVSDIPGTTTDPVMKNIELPGVGAATLTDTPGIDDTSVLGPARVRRTIDTVRKCDIAIITVSAPDYSDAAGLEDVNQKEAQDIRDSEAELISMLDQSGIPYIIVLSKCDLTDQKEEIAARLYKKFGKQPVMTDSGGFGTLTETLVQAAKSISGEQRSITAGLVNEGDVVILVMPQDSEAPKGRIIMPQNAVIRELLEKKCTTVCTVPEQLGKALSSLSSPPSLVITDSQAFKTVAGILPSNIRLTSFSILFAAYKGDIDIFLKGAEAIDSLKEDSKVLIAEACTHVPAGEDIGRVKIPAMLRSRVGDRLEIDFVSGNDFPENLCGYDLVIHCGACMFNRRYVLSRISQAEEQNVPVTNYGIAIAHLSGILPRTCIPRR